MASFPTIAELPPVVHTTGWLWTPFKAPSVASNGFWLGTDRQGNRWLTKRRGDFYAYREIVFGRLAQRMGWSCQSTVFIQVDAESAHHLQVQPGSIHAGHWFLDEHVYPPCDGSRACFLGPLLGRRVQYVEDLCDISVAHILDWPKSELAACLFGGNEPPGRLFTAAHEFVIIDSELMFSTTPESFECTTWWGDKDNPRPSGVAIAKEVCAEFSRLPDSAISDALALPSGVSVSEHWPISPILQQSRAFAEFFSHS